MVNGNKKAETFDPAFTLLVYIKIALFYRPRDN
jgi:hypothetical protein